MLAAAGPARLRPPRPGQRSRRSLDALLAAVPELRVRSDTFEPRVPHPTTRAVADTYDSGKKKQHIGTTQVAVAAVRGRVVDVSDSVPGPTHDLTLLAESRLLEHRPPDVGGMGDLAYVGMAKLHPRGRGATPRRTPRGTPRPAADVAYTQACARRRIGVEHSMGRMRHDQARTQMDRHHRRYHLTRARAVAGLANHQIDHRLP